MPLPVERSQGTVSSLVARFQTAANRDAEQARRQSLPPPRRSSGNTFVQPEAVSSAKEAPTGKESDKQPVTEPAPASANGHERGTASAAEHDEPGTAEKRDKGKLEHVKEKAKSLAEGMKDLAIGGDVSATHANEEMAKSDKPPVKDSPAKVRTTKSLPAAGLEEDVAVKTNGAMPTPSKAKDTKTTGSTPTKKPATSIRSERSAKPAATVPAPSTSSTRTRIDTAGGAKARTPVPTSPTQAKRSSAGSKVTSPPPKSAAKPATPVATVKSPPNRTQRLTPALTGPARRTSSSQAQHPEPAPLKPHLTGTPSKPTASYLAKTRTPSSSSAHERRESSSLGRATGSTASARARLSSGSPSPAPSGIRSPPTKSTLSASGSRLLQGTAASRAKVADAKSPPPKSVSTVKAKTGTPTKKNGDAAKADPDTEGSDAPLRAPVGLRVGLAGAGMGKGGKTGKEYNEEQNEKLRKGEITGEEIVRQADEPLRQDATAIPDSDNAGAMTTAENDDHADAVAAAQSQIDVTDPTAVVEAGEASPQAVNASQSAAGIDTTLGLEDEQASLASPTADEKQTEGAPAGQAEHDVAQADLEEIPDV